MRSLLLRVQAQHLQPDRSLQRLVGHRLDHEQRQRGQGAIQGRQRRIQFEVGCHDGLAPAQVGSLAAGRRIGVAAQLDPAVGVPGDRRGRAQVQLGDLGALLPRSWGRR